MVGVACRIGQPLIAVTSKYVRLFSNRNPSRTQKATSMLAIAAVASWQVQQAVGGISERTCVLGT